MERKFLPDANGPQPPTATLRFAPGRVVGEGRGGNSACLMLMSMVMAISVVGSALGH